VAVVPTDSSSNEIISVTALKFLAQLTQRPDQLLTFGLTSDGKPFVGLAVSLKRIYTSRDEKKREKEPINSNSGQ